jgi:hypothetical protein
MGSQTLIPTSAPTPFVASLSNISPQATKKLEEGGLVSPSLAEQIITCLKSAYTRDPKPRVCRQAARLLGSLSRPLAVESAMTLNSPSDLSYLGDESIARMLFDELRSKAVAFTATSSGSQAASTRAGRATEQVKAILGALTAVQRYREKHKKSLMI